MLTLHFEGTYLDRLDHEAGAHRLQRVPPTERQGRAHTSTVTVAVLGEGLQVACELVAAEVRERITKGTGPGGQNRNKRETAVILTHLPTGIEVKAESERTQEANRRVAMSTLLERVTAHYAQAAHAANNQARKAQVGTGERAGVKRRTWRFQDDCVLDHITGQRARAADVMRGRFDLLWR